MKNRFLLLMLLSNLISVVSFGQKDTAKFKDGTSIVYEIIDNNPDNMKKLNLSYLALSGVSLSYSQPKVFSISVDYDNWKYGAEGLFFLTSYEQERARKFIIKSEMIGVRYEKNYIIRPIITIKTYLGIHLGYYVFDYSKQYLSAYTDYLKNKEMFLGLALTRLRCTKLNIYSTALGIKRNGVIQTNLYCDIVHYSDRDFAGTNRPSTGTLDDNSVSLGYRVYAEGKMSYSIKREQGLTWRFGFQNGPYKKVTILYGLGYYFGF